MVNRSKPIVWVINTHATGDLRGAQGVAAKINPDFSTHEIRGKSKAEIGRHYITKFGTSQIEGHPDWPDFIISAGKNLASAAIAVKKLSGGKTFIIQILPPKKDIGLVDLIVIPEHRINDRLRSLSNHIATIGVPHFITEENLQAAKLKWADRFANLPGQRIAVLLGGKRGTFVLTPELAAKMGAEINAKAQALGASLIICNSRRTDLVGTANRNPEITNAFMAQISVPHFAYRWGVDAIENPYLGVLACSDALIVTGDSMSMPCEAGLTGKPVFINSFGGATGHTGLHTQLYEHGLAKPFEIFLDKGIVPWEYKSLDTAGFVAEAAIRRQQEIRPKKQSTRVALEKISDKIIAEKSFHMADDLFSFSIIGLQATQEALKSDKDFQHSFLRTIKLIRDAKHGRVLITGIGKSLRVGELIAASWGSLSIPCEIIDPTHAVHGDLGKMLPEAGDILIIISKSGKVDGNTQRVLETAVERGYKIVAITHSDESALSAVIKKLGDRGILVKIPEAKEPHPFLNQEGTKISPPTVSTTQVKGVLEAIGLALAKLRDMRVEHFQQNHPAGALGAQPATRR